MKRLNGREEGEELEIATGRPQGSETVPGHARGNSRSQPPGERALEEYYRAVARPLAAAADDDDVGPNVVTNTTFQTQDQTTNHNTQQQAVVKCQISVHWNRCDVT